MANQNQQFSIQFIAPLQRIEIKMDRQSSDRDLPITPLKTIEYQPPTRHPTSNKNQTSHSPPPHTHPEHPNYHLKRTKSQRYHSHSLRESLSTYQWNKHQCLQEGKYHQAAYWEKEIGRAQSLIAKRELKRVRLNTAAEEKSIKQSYKHQVSFFQTAWNSYFDRCRQLEKSKIKQFKTEENEEIGKARQRLMKRCSSLHRADSRVLQLQKAEQYHLSKGNIQQLALVRAEKKKIMAQAKKEREELIERWTREQGEALRRQQSRKYEILMSTLEERRRDQQKNFLTQKKRLKQKYKNVLSQLRHYQKINLQLVTRQNQPREL